MSTSNTNDSVDPCLPSQDPASSGKPSALSSTWQTIAGLISAYDSGVPELELQALEARILYDASPLIAMVGEAIEDCPDLEVDADNLFLQSDFTSDDNRDDSEAYPVIDSTAFVDRPDRIATVSRQLVVIDERVDGFEALVQDITANVGGETAYDVLLVGKDDNGFELVAEYLNGVTTYGAVHLVGHGNDNSIQLGSESLSSDSIEQHGAELTNWNRGLEEGADILLYGCEVASGEQGQELVDKISAVTGADVAASDDLTGHALLGGDWEFEFIVGNVDTDVAFSLDVQQGWMGTLQTVTVTTLDDVVDGNTTSINDLTSNQGADGTISLREAIIAANGTYSIPDTIVLGSGIHTLTLTGSGDELGDLDLNSNVEIVGAADGSTVIDATSLGDRVFHLLNQDVTLRNLTIQGGSTTEALGGGGLLVAGSGVAEIDNVAFSGNTAINGGAIRSSTNLIVTNSTFDGNYATSDGGAIAIYGGTNDFNNVTFSGNTADSRGGALFVTNGTSTFTNVTFSGNSASTSGGGISISNGTINLEHATITDNTAGTGGGIQRASGTVNLSDSIVAGNVGSIQNQEISGAINSGGNNIIGDDAGDSVGGSGYDTGNGDQLDQTGLSLGALADNGGLVQTHELLGSVGVDEAGAAMPDETDARGYFVNDPNRDIGAYERGATSNLDEDLIAHFEFEEGGGLDAVDSAQGNTGNIIGGPTWTTDSATGSLALDLSGDAVGNNQYINVPDNPLYDFGTGEFTISLWYNMTTPTEMVRLIGNIDPLSGGSGFALRAQTSGEFILERSDGIVSSYSYGGAIMDGQWHHLSVVVDSSGLPKFFVDGVETTSSFVASNVNVNSSDSLFIGAVDGTTGDFDGKLDEVRLYSRALSATEASQLTAGTAQQAPTSAPTDLSSGIELNSDGGNDAYFEAVNAATIFGGATDLTVDLSFQLNNDAGDAPHLISYVSPTGVPEFQVYLGTSDNIYVDVDGASFAGNLHPELRDGEMHQVSVTWDNSTGQIAIYVDGELSSTGNVAAGQSLNPTGTLVLGQGQPSIGQVPIQSMDGTFYDVRVWDHARTSSEITLGYRQKIDVANVPSGLVANWQFDGFDGGGLINDVVTGSNSLSVQHATGAGFTASTPVEDLHVFENANNGTSVGFVSASDPDFGNDVVLDGRFTEQPIAGSFETVTGVANFGDWEVPSGQQAVFYNDPALFGWTPEGGRPVELGNAGGPGGVKQYLSTEIGQTYQVTFAVTGDFGGGVTSSDLRVTTGGSSVNFTIDEPNGWTNTDPVWDYRTVTFTATDTNTTLGFESLELAGTRHAVIGDVAVVEVPEAVNTILANDPGLTYDAATGKFYKLVNAPTQWTVANTIANSFEINGVTGNLASVRSAHETVVLQQLLQTQSVFGAWIGATDAGAEGTWVWQDGSNDVFYTGGTQVPGMYENFGLLEPSGGTSENYAELVAVDGTFNDLGNTDARAYVIEWDASEVLSSFTYTLTDDANGRFAIDSNTGEILVADGTQLDYETNTSHDITVEVADAAGNTYSEVMTIVIDDAVESADPAPTDLSSGIELNTDGGNDAYLISQSGLSQNLTASTIEVRFEGEEIDNGAESAFFSYFSGQDLMTLTLDSATNGLELDFGFGTPVIATGLDYGATLLDGEPHTLSTTWDNTNGDWAIYIDGQFVESGNGLATGQTIDAISGRFVLGNDQDLVDAGYTASQAFSGTIYDVRVWSEVRSAAEISGSYLQKIDTSNLPGSLEANWQMDGFNGSNEVVDVVSGNNLSVGHATGAGFTASTPVDDLNIDENSANGTTVGFVAPTDPTTTEDLVEDGSFTHAGSGFQTFTAGQTIGGSGGSWEVVSGSVDVEGGWPPSPLGGTALDLDGVSAGSVIQRSLPTEPGVQYQVTFALTGNFQGGFTEADLNVSAGDASVDFHADMPDGWNRIDNLLWEHRTFTFTANSTSTDLQFSSLSDPASTRGPVIGDVQVVEIPAAVTTILNSDPSLSYDAASGKFYKAIPGALNRSVALSLAQSELLNGIAGKLPTIETGSENATVQSLAQSIGSNVWLGGSDNAVEGTWIWEDGSQFWNGDTTGTNVPGEYSNWTAGQPDSGGSGIQDFNYMFSGSGEWADSSGSTINVATVIEWDAAEVLTNYTFNLTDDANGRFAIDSNTGEITVADGSQLNHEANASHNVTVEVTDAGGNTYSEVMSIAVNDVNDAPVVTGGTNLTLGTVAENDANPPGMTVADLLASGTGDPIADDDVGALEGIAIAAADNSNGSWQYSLNGAGGPWNGFPGVSTTNALLLDPTAMIRFVPNPGYTGVNDAIAFFAWDQTDSSSSGDVVDASALNRGGGNAYSVGALTATLEVVADTNDAPTYNGSLDGNITYVEGSASAVSMDGNVTIFDEELSAIDDFGGATLTLARVGSANAEDNFNRVAGTNLTFSGANFLLSGVQKGAYVLSGGTITLTFDSGVTNAEVNEVMQSIGYRNLSDNPPTSVDIQWTFNDGNTGAQGSGGQLTAVGTTTVNITAVNDAPEFTGLDASPTFIEDGPAVVLDSNVTVNDPELSDANNFDGATVYIGRDGGPSSEDVFSAGGLLGPLTEGGNVVYDGTLAGSVNLNSNGVLIIQFNSNATGAMVDGVLQEIRYSNTNNNPPANVTLNWTFNDNNSGAQGAGGSQFDSHQMVVNITPADDAPVVDTTSVFPVWFTEDNAPVGADVDLLVSDVDSPTLQSATLAITANYTQGEDFLYFTNQNGISHSWDAVNGILTLTGSASVTDYQTALRSVQFENTSQDPDTADRTLSWTVNDGTSDSGTLTRNIEVTAVNDAPVLDNSGSMSLTSVAEDSSGNTGDTVANIIASAGGDRITDVDGPLEGIAVYNTDSANGSWEYSLDGGTTWLELDTVSGAQARLLDASSMIRFEPSADFHGTAALSFRAWDQTAGTVGDAVVMGTFGNSLSVGLETASITVTPVNDAPSVTNNGGIVDEGNYVTVTPAMLQADDVDDAASDLTYAISNISNGQFETSGAPGVAVTSFTQEQINNGQIVFLHDGSNTSTASFDFSLADGGEDGAMPATGTFNFTVTFVNDAPTTASSTSNGFEDSVLGVAIVGADSDGTVESFRIINLPANGMLYSDAGLSNAVAANSVINAGGGGVLNLWFEPTSNWNGTTTFDFAAIDNEGLEDSTPAMKTLNLAAVNDAPVLDNSVGPHFDSITEDDFNNGGETVSSLLSKIGNPITDVDAGASEGVAVIVNNGNGGTWQYSINGGASWQDVGAVSNSLALLLRDTDLLRMSPDGDQGTNANIGFRAWDQTSGTVGTKVNIVSSGGTTAFSNQTLSAQIAVTGVNDAPVFESLPDAQNTSAATVTDGNYVASGDFNGDGYVDLVTTSSDGSIAWHENDGTGEFVSSSTIISLDQPEQVVVADIDNDGDLDIIAANYAVGSFADVVQLLNDGSGNFTQYNLGTTADEFFALDVGDIDGDGDLDVVAAAYSSDEIMWWEQTNPGNWSLQTIANTDGPYSVELSDIDNDGDMDIVSTSFRDNQVQIHYNDGAADPTFTSTVIKSVNAVFEATTVDIDNDGDLDIVYGNWGLNEQLAWLENDGSANPDFTEHLIDNGPWGTIYHISHGDLNGDGNVDLVVSDGAMFDGGVIQYLGDGTGNFSKSIIDDGSQSEANTLVDVDGDGDLDVVALKNTSNALAINDNQGDGFIRATTYEDSVAIVGPVVVSDVDANAGELQVSIVVNNGSVDLESIVGLTFSQGDGTEDAAMTFTGTLANINGAMNSLRFTPQSDFHGIGSIEITVDDQGNTGSGGALSAQETLYVEVLPVNDAPDGANNTITLLEDGAHSFSVGTFGFTDVESDSFQSVTITTLPTNGTLTLGGVNVAAGQEITAAELPGLLYRGAPDVHGMGVDSFTFQVRDDGGTSNGGFDTDQTPNTISINIVSVNDTPTASAPATLNATEQFGLSLDGAGFTLGDEDSGNSLIEVVFEANEGVVVTGIGDSGVTVSNTAAGTTITGTVAQISDLLNGSTTGAVTYVNNSDTPSSSVTLTMTVNDLGNMGADPGLTGDANSEEVSTTTTINITPVNDAPETTSFSVGASEDATSVTVVLSGSDVDGNSTIAGYQILSLPANGMVYSDAALTIPVALNSLVPGSTPVNLYYVPDADFNGIDSFDFATVDDQGLADPTPGSVTVNVSPVNDAPVLTNLDGDIVNFGAGDSATLLDAGVDVLVADVDSADFDGAVLNVTITNADMSEDELSIQSVGNGPGEISYDGSSIRYEGVVIGTSFHGIDPMSGAIAIGVVLNADADEVAVTALLRSITYENSDVVDPTTTSRIVEFVLTDGDGGTSSVSTVTVNVAANVAPESTDASFTGNEDAASIPISISGSDTDGTISGYRIISLPSNGTLYTDMGLTNPVTIGTLSTSLSSVSLFFVPDANFNGLDTFEFSTVDNLGLEDATPGTVSLNVAPVNDAPVLDNSGNMSLDDISEDDYTSDGTSVGDIIASSGGDRITDIDTGSVEGIALTGVDNSNGTWQYRVFSGDAWSDVPAITTGDALLLNPASSIRFVPNADFNGSAGDITFRAWDRSGPENAGSVVTINGVGGSMPYSTAEETASINVLAINDAPVIDLDADDSSGATGSGYQTTYNAGGGYQPIVDSADAILSDVDSPILQSMTIQITNRIDGTNESLDSTIGGLGLIEDFDPATGTYTLTGPASVAVFEQALRSLTYNNASTTPDLTQRVITVIANDGVNDSAPVSAFVSISPDANAPTQVNNSGITVDEGGQWNFDSLELAYNDLQPSSEVSYTVTTGPASGYLALASDTSTPITSFTQEQIDLGGLIYVHDGSEVASDSFTFTADDGQGNSLTGQTVNIVVAPVNDAPVISTSGLQTVPEDAVLTFSSANGNAISVSDVDAGSSDIQVTLTVTNGTLDLAQTNGLTFAVGDGVADASLTFAGSLVDVNAALDGLTYSPTADFNGSSTLVVLTNDLGNTGAGGSLTDTATVNIDVSSVNDVPITNNSLTTVIEDTVEPFSLSASDFDGSVVAFSVTSLPANGTVYLDAGLANPIALNTEYPALGGVLQLYFKPDADWNGLDVIEYHAKDDQGGWSTTPGSFSFDVEPVDDAPVAANDSYSILEDETFTATLGVDDLLQNDLEVDGETLVVNTVPVAGPTNGTLSLGVDGTFTYTPNENYFGSDTFTYEISDGISSTQATVTITVDSVNDAPETNSAGASAIEDAASVEIVFGGSDVEGAIDSFRLDSLPANGTLYTDASLTTVAIVGNSYLANANGVSFHFVPDANWNGTTSFEASAVDIGGLADPTPAVATINVASVNDGPVAEDDFYSVDEDGTLVATAGSDGLLDNDDDADNDTLSAVLIDGPTNGIVSISSDGSFTYTPNANYNGMDSFTYEVNDGNGGRSQASVEISVVSVNDAPTGTDPSVISIAENIDTSGGVTVAALVSEDVDMGETFTYSVVGGSDSALFSVIGNELILDDGVLDYETKDQYTVVVRVTDAGGLSYDETIEVNVTDVYDGPVIGTANVNLDEGQTVGVGSSELLTSAFGNAPGGITYVVTTLPTNGVLSINGNSAMPGDAFTQQDVNSGAISYAHSGSNTTSDSFTFDVSENGGQELTDQVFEFTINPVNDIPVAVADTFSVTEDGSLTNVQVVNNDTDDDGDSLSVSIVSAPNRGGTVEINDDGTFDYQPRANFFGTETFEYEVNDGNGGVAKTSVTINVSAVNDAPVVASDFFQIIPGQPLISLDGVLQNDFDIENSALSAVLLAGPNNGTLTFLSNGQFIYGPNSGFVGTDSFTYLASDGNSTSPATVEIAVTSVIGPVPPSFSPPISPGDPTDDDDRGNPFDPTVGINDDLNGQNGGDNDTEDNAQRDQGIFDLPRLDRGVPVLDLRNEPQFNSGSDDLEDLVFAMADQNRAAAMMKVLLQNVEEGTLSGGKASEEVERLRENASFATVYDAQFLFDQLDEVEVGSSVLGDFEFTIGAVTALGTVGYILWALRGGALVALALSQLPAWQMIDPLPILDGYEARKETEEGDLDGYFTG
jgi:predicted outer membrane repeat protein